MIPAALLFLREHEALDVSHLRGTNVAANRTRNASSERA
jgi:hypothetical protein